MDSQNGAAAHILVAEDNEANRLLMVEALKLFGYRVTVAGDGQEALEALSTQAFALVLMDCRMPVMDGLEATRALRLRELQTGQPPVPVIALTAFAMPEDEALCLAAGMTAYMAKPIDLAQLRVKINQLVGSGL